MLLVLAVLAVASVGLRAQLPTPPTAASQFDITGFLQSATLDGVGSGLLQGGHIVVNGHTVTLPSNTIVILPANALTWAELFTTAPSPYTNVATGMALNDVPTPMSTYQVHVVGNVVAGDLRAGLVTISQDALNTGAGYINFIDYAKGEIYVGAANGATGARIAINDPVGRYGRVVSPDPRFTVDSENPTIRSVTGYPMCVPRFAGASAGVPGADPQCPQSNRQFVNGAFSGVFTMSGNFPPGSPTGPLDPRLQAPFEIGDYVTFAGTLVHDGGSPTASPWPGAANTYISAHTIVNNIAIYTAAGIDPVYVAIDVALLGTGGVTAPGAAEAAVRTRFEGFSTDVTRNVHLYGIDVLPTGQTGDRDWGKVGVDSGIVALGGAVAGRWRFRPPCTATVVGPDAKGCTPPPTGVFLPATREVRAVVESTTGTANTRVIAANGLTTGQYHAPIGEYIFPEQIPGAPVPPANFETMPFLASGGYMSAGGFTPNPNLNGPFVQLPGTLAPGALNPWVADAAPLPPPPIPPGVIINGPSSIASGTTVLFTSTVTVSPGAIASYAWTATKGTFSAPTAASTNYTAPVVTATEAQTITLTVTDSITGLSTAQSVTVTINAPNLPTVTINPAGPLSVPTGVPQTLNASCTFLGVDQTSKCTFTWTQLPGGGLTVLPNPVQGKTLNFIPTLPPATPAATIQIAVTAVFNPGGGQPPSPASAPQIIVVTVNPVPDVITMTTEYRTGKQRLLITATTNAVGPNVVLRLEPYLTTTGTIVDPGPLGIMLNTGGGIYTLDIVGIQEPALPPATPLVVISNLGGSTGPTQLQRIRQ
ncbi:MAG TPA: hypothetical protein VKE96_29480 [Vicinamibacterales bacterium]|nr:hypothetical protein [Vicinamibacterales bacterium]